MDRRPSDEPAGEQSLGEYLKDVRASRRNTLREVEDATGVSNAYLSQLEHDSIKKPSPHFLHKLAEFYAVPYDRLMEKAGYIKRVEKKATPGSGRSGKLAASSLGSLSREEEEQLLQYLAFIRSRKAKE
jgi:HTH-type transcriptional regulator, competence development regulator